jgi:hypothetical protein
MALSWIQERNNKKHNLTTTEMETFKSISLKCFLMLVAQYEITCENIVDN